MATRSHPRLPAGERLRRAGIGAWSIIGILILAYLALWALLKVRVILPPLVLALLIIYMLNPVVGWLERKGVPRVVGALGSYVVVLGGVTLLVIALIPVVSQQVTEFGRQIPAFRADVAQVVDDTAARVEELIGTDVDTTQVDCLLGSDQAPSAAECNEATRQLREQVTAQAGRLTEIGTSLLEVLLVFILAPLIALYLLIDLPRLGHDLANLVPLGHREEMIDLGNKVSRAVGGFFRGQLFVALAVGIMSSIGFYIIDLPFWLVIGAIAGFFNLVPLVGPYIGGGLGFLVGTFSGGIGLGLKAALVELIVQQLDNHVISPNVMKRTVNLHPVTVMLSLLAGATLAGFWGVLLGVPAVAVGKLILGHVWATRVLGVPVTSSNGATAGEPPTPLPDSARGPVEGELAEAHIETPPGVEQTPPEEAREDDETRETPEEHVEPYPVPDRRA